jgi:glutamine synthetase
MRENPLREKYLSTDHKGDPVPYQAEYIWIDGTEPSPLLRSKTRILADDKEPPIWGFDGSSTNQAEGSNSDCVLRPVFICPDPLRGIDDVLVMCEVLNVDMKPHSTNMRAKLETVAKKYARFEPIFGLEQEYTFMQNGRPYGWPSNGYPAPQGPYYCGVGGDIMPGRDIVEAHTAACMAAGLAIEGTNAEVMMGQWEFQIGALPPLEVSDQLWVARWLLFRIAEDFGVFATLEPKPMLGDWNGAGCHTNYSTKPMREEGGYRHIIAACEAIGKKVDEHIENYGPGVELRLTGAHETAHYTEFSYGVSDRGASIRIPWQVAIDKKGYLEDRRPNANMDPYRVTRVIVNTTCSASSGGSGSSSAKKASSKNGSSKKAGSKKAAKKSASTKTLTSVDVLPKKSSKRR